MATDGRLDGKVALVTGASSAIGRAIALRFAAAGARAVVVADLQVDPREGGKPTHEVIRADGGEAVFVRTDVTDLTELQAAVDAVLDVNLKGTFFACQAAGRAMVRHSRGGVILNLSSIGGLHGMAGISAYCAAKGAVRLLTYSLAKELGEHGIRVCALHPGVIDTSMTRADVRFVTGSSLTIDGGQLALG